MNGVALLIAVSSLGVDYSYRTADDGRLEYTIQIEPEFLKSLADGEEIHSDVPPDVGNVERLVIRVGTTPARHSAAQIAEYKRLRVSSGRYASRDTTLTSVDTLPTIVWPAKTNPEETFTVDYGWQPDQAAQLSYYVQMQPTLLASLAVGDEIHAPVDPAVGRVGRFVILSGNKQLPRVGGEPAPAPETKLAASRSRSRFQTGTSQTYGPPVSGSTSSGSAQNNPRTFTPAANNEFSPAEEPAYVPRSRFNSTTSDQGGYVAPASDPLAPPPYQPGFEQPRGAFNQPRTNDPGVAPRTGYQNQYQPPAGTLQPPNDQYAQQGGYNPPAGYAPQPGYAPPAYQQPADNRVASVTRETTTASTPLPAPQVTASTTAPATAAVTTPETERPWWPLMFTCFALFLSIGGNLYLGWTAAEFYNRYRLATDRLRSAART